MPQVSDFLREFQSSLEEPALPEEIARRFSLESALGHREGGGVWLLRRREDGAPFVLKIDREDGQDLFEEFRLLARLPAGLGPEPVECFVSDGVRYMVRSYLPGQPLDEAWDPGEGLERWRELGEALCRLLARLHSLDPPIVHRDVKPENIILSPEGKPGLIDFGIARCYKPERDTDTVHIGTRATAAPEQYGFAQSDQRTDLYALGVTLRWMLTGSYGPEALETADCPAWVKRFLRKAAAFDPADRFPSASAMADALRRGAGQRRWRPLAAALLALCLVCVAGLAAHRVLGEAEAGPAGGDEFLEDVDPPHVDAPAPAAPGREEDGSGLDFGSPLLEAAVRAALDKPEGPVALEELSAIRRLSVVGEHVLGEETSYRYCLTAYVDEVGMYGTPYGDIEDLSLLAYMPNLEVLHLCQQEIRDISPLAGLENLRELYLADNAIEDFSSLAGLRKLEVLHAGGNLARDLSPLSSLRGLRELNLDNWSVRPLDSLAPLAGLHVQILSLGYVEPEDKDWSFLSEINSLDQLWLWDPTREALQALADCPSLRHLHLCNYNGSDLTALPVIYGLRNLSIMNNVSSLEGVQRQERLSWVDVFDVPDMDLAPLKALEELRGFSMSSTTLSDFSPLGEIPTLQTVELEEDDLDALEASCPEHSFEIVVMNW